MSTKTLKIGRSAKTGKLTSVSEARKYPKSHAVERMPKKGRRDAKKINHAILRK